MSKIITEQLIYEILSVVDEIPEGKVAAYGQIAALIGREKNARLVPGWVNQRYLLEEEDVLFKENGCINLKKCQWDGK